MHVCLKYPVSLSSGWLLSATARGGGERQQGDVEKGMEKGLTGKEETEQIGYVGRKFRMRDQPASTGTLSRLPFPLICKIRLNSQVMVEAA